MLTGIIPVKPFPQWKVMGVQAEKSQANIPLCLEQNAFLPLPLLIPPLK